MREDGDARMWREEGGGGDGDERMWRKGGGGDVMRECGGRRVEGGW